MVEMNTFSQSEVPWPADTDAFYLSRFHSIQFCRIMIVSILAKPRRKNSCYQPTTQLFWTCLNLDSTPAPGCTQTMMRENGWVPGLSITTHFTLPWFRTPVSFRVLLIPEKFFLS